MAAAMAREGSLSGGRLGHYRILEKLGAGGMGEVFRAHDEQLDRDVAIKVLPEAALGDLTARARLLREARAAAALNHRFICTIHEVGEADGNAYIAMELVEGQPLADVLKNRTLPTAEVIRYGRDIAEALAHAHARHIVHRDLKAANVLITGDGGVKVLDFGLAKRLGSEFVDEATTQVTLTEAGTFVGTLAYMAPEQLRGEPADARADIWALGVVLYEMAVRRRPFDGRTTVELISRVLSEPAAACPPDVPVAFQMVLDRCLEKTPARRYQSAVEVRAALEAIESASSPGTTIAFRLTRHRWLAAGAAAAGFAFSPPSTPESVFSSCCEIASPPVAAARGVGAAAAGAAGAGASISLSTSASRSPSAESREHSRTFACLAR